MKSKIVQAIINEARSRQCSVQTVQTNYPEWDDWVWEHEEPWDDDWGDWAWEHEEPWDDN